MKMFPTSMIGVLRPQVYGKNAQTTAYHSEDPFDFGIDKDEQSYVTTLPVAAPEIILYQGEWFIAALLPSLKGIQISRMESAQRE